MINAVVLVLFQPPGKLFPRVARLEFSWRASEELNLSRIQERL